jgi:hypothetical protein
LADNGGPTMTHALLAGSPAIDAGDPNFDPADPDGNPLTDDAVPFDQRGALFWRIYDGDASGAGTIDIGAFELHLAPPSTPGPLAGDFNRDNVVDAADYPLWRKTLAATALPAFSGADADGDGSVEPGEYDVWTENFGETLAGAGSGAEVPELQALRIQSVEPAKTALVGSHSTAMSANGFIARAFDFVMLETSFRTPDASSKVVLRPNTQYRLAESRGDDLGLLAIARVGRNLPRDFGAPDDEADDEHRDDDIEGGIDQPLAVALAEWH